MSEEKNREIEHNQGGSAFSEASQVPAEKTYGEKMHDLIFSKIINFWTTLAISGLFVFWVKHSETPIKFLGDKLPRDFHNMVRDWFSKQGVFKMLPGGDEVALVTADALTINLPGLATILPSAWLGNKFKTSIVEGLDKAHYGDNAENDPRIAERHRIVENEKRPTFAGALSARVGGMTAGVFTGYLIGAKSGKNMISRLGKNEKALAKMPGLKVLEHFNGVDHYASNLGDRIGGFVTDLFPKFSDNLNSFFRKGGIGWDPATLHAKTLEGIPTAESVELLKEFEASKGVYNRATRDWGKWTAADIMYTIVTSTTIGPFVSLIGKLPGMSYKQKPKAHAIQHDDAQPTQARTLPAPMIDERAPKARLTEVASNERLTPQLQAQLNG